ncbi:hypothetical protein N7528_006308 [Penicillium herquei]|nr:hypothetical protein N7528_006308 [Penicillium herquei]
MALILSQNRSSGPDPTQNLTNALENFRNALTNDEKRQFQGNTAKPDAASVLDFVKHVDNINNRTMTQCVSMRLFTFLSATQQFTGVVDTFISANPTIAALVWGGLKTAILVASNVSSYFEKVTRMIMDIGRSCPTFQQFGQLYPGCVGLQGALCDYYAVIINLCVKLIQVSHRSSTTQTLLSIINPFESEFQPILDELNKEVEQVKQHISLASKQASQEENRLSEFERQKNSSFRASALKFFKVSEREQAEAEEWRMHQMKREIGSLKTSVRDNLSQVNHVAPWRRALKQRIGGTAEWLQTDPAFIQWKESSGVALLWCSGTMGVGKTILMSNAVLQLHDQRQSDIISYFFCRAEDSESLLARNIFGSVVSQLLHTKIEESLYFDLVSLARRTQDLSTNETIQLLLSQMDSDTTYYVILDGLDECDSSQIQAVARGLGQLCKQSHLKLKILCGGRPGLEKELFMIAKPTHIISIEKATVNPDIKRYLEVALEKYLEEGRLILEDDSLKKKILDALQAGSDGMFLWASLCLEEICEQNSDWDILEALEHLPRGLAEIFNQRLNRIHNGKLSNQAVKVLQYCGVVKRPLTTEEYREALSILPGQKTLDTKKLPHSMEKVIRACYGLTFIDEEELTVHYAHHSIKTHLFTAEHNRSSQYNFNCVDVHFGHMCMTYLNFTNFKGQVLKFQKGSAAPVDPIQIGTSSLFGLTSPVHSIAKRLTEGREKTPKMTIGEMERLTLQNLKGPGIPQHGIEFQLQKFAFLKYARESWFIHMKYLDLVEDHGGDAWRLLRRCIKSDDIPSIKPWNLPIDDPLDKGYSKQLVSWIIDNGHAPLLKSFGEQHRYFSSEELFILLDGVEKCDLYRFTDVILSTKFGITPVLKRLLDHVFDAGCERSIDMVLTWVTTHHETSLFNESLLSAVIYNRLDVIDVLISSGADLNGTNAKHGVLRENCEYTPLYLAAYYGHAQAAERLLKNGADVNLLSRVDKKSFSGWDADSDERLDYFKRMTPLHAAIVNQHYTVVDILLAAGADVDADSIGLVKNDVSPLEDGKAALHYAVQNNPLGILHTARKEYPHMAGSRDRLQAVRLLLEHGANINLASRAGLTPFHIATKEGSLDVMALLLDQGAAINDLAATFGTPLHLAAELGRLEATEFLLTHGASVNIRSRGGETALQIARRCVHSSIVRLLLAAGAED